MRSYRRARPLQRQNTAGDQIGSPARSNRKKCLKASSRFCLIGSVKIRFPLGPVIITGLLLVEALSVAAQPPSPSISRRIKSRFIQAAPSFDPDASRPAWPRVESPRSIRLEPPPGRDVQELLPPSPTPLSSPSPEPSALPFPTASIEPSITPLASATPSIVPSATPIPTISIPPSPTPPPAATPAFPVPAPNLAPVVADAPPQAPALASSAPSLSYLQDLTPVVEVWRTDALTPELPTRRGKYMSAVLITGDETVIVRLRFGTQANGKPVVLTASPGVALNPQQEAFVLPVTADLALSIGLAQSSSRGAISFYCEGLITTLPLTRLLPTAQQTVRASSQGVGR
jgi:hypothetical protein